MRRPEPDWTTMNAVYSRDHELVSRFSELEGGFHEGATGFTDFLAAIDSMGEWQSTTEGIRVAPDGRLVVITRFEIHTQHSDVPIAQQMGTVVSVHDGRIQTTEAYRTPREALEAVGLRE